MDGRRHRRGFRPAQSPICRWSRKAYSITDEESIADGARAAAKEGILAGSSSGTLLAAALRYCREQTTPKRVVTFVCDSGNKYLSKMFNDFWMVDQGFLRAAAARRPARPDRAALRRGRDRDRSAPDDTLLTAFQRMRAADVSQLPVLEGEHVVGILDESDILLRCLRATPERFRDPVAHGDDHAAGNAAGRARRSSDSAEVFDRD